MSIIVSSVNKLGQKMNITKQIVQYLEIDLHEGLVVENKKVPVDISKPIVNQVLNQVIIGDDKESVVDMLVGGFNSESTGYKYKTQDVLYLIIL